MNTTYPLTIYFDASCRLCDSEMHNIKLHDADNQLILIDCSAPDFDDTVCKANNISQTAMMNRLHAQDANGQWLIGVAAFEVIYQTVGMATIAKLWGYPIAERLYPWVVRHRYTLSWMGLPHLFGLWSRHAARQAEKRSRLCNEGRCSING
ncbi:thiol-disulfide oxidoreductase DCC family protein [Methyloglobulus sp.]|uniref:thiol-disulfide oxidoreductase DCC family protein n=1 Tax=Methyloglobulus sp. TaxID=2518622 RepID=UPI003989ABBC